jgi:MOSC domain-containing protein YiiM
MSRIEHLLLSVGHNYFGHHGGAAGTHPCLAAERVECVAGRGLRGDRFFDYQPDYKGQITFFAMEVLAAMEANLGVSGILPTAVRRNVFTRGLELNALIGREFAMQGVRFAGVEECRPCYWMNQAVAPGAEAWLQGRGGLRAKIITDGWLSRGAADVVVT